MKSYLVRFLALCLVAGLLNCSATASKRSMGEVIDDNVVAMKLRTKLTKDKAVKLGDMDVKVWKGIVTLTGSQDNQEQINRAIEISEQQQGVKEVKAFLVLKDMDPSSSTPKKTVSLWPIKKKNQIVKKNSVNEIDLSPDNNDSPLDQKTSKIVKSNTNKKTESVTSSGSDFQDVEY